MVYLLLFLFGLLAAGLFIKNRSMVTRINELKSCFQHVLSGSALELKEDFRRDQLAELRELFLEMYSRFEKSRQDLEENYQKVQLSNVTLEEKYAQAYTLQLIQEEIGRELDSHKLLKKTLDILLGVFGSRRCVIYMINEQSEMLELKASSGFVTRSDETNIPLSSDHLFARAYREKKVFTNIDDEEITGVRITVDIVVPLNGRHNCLGVLVMENDMVREINQDLINFAKLISQEISLSLENAYLYDKMRYMATHDALTGVYNRVYLMDYITELFKTDPEKVSIIIFDLDHFKKINDQYGHIVGDMVLKNISGLAREMVPSGILARYGGEEFVIVLPGFGLQEALDFTEKLRRAVADMDNATEADSDIKVTLSAGVVSYPEITGSFKLLLQLADKALYRAKNSGRNRICFATPENCNSDHHG